MFDITKWWLLIVAIVLFTPPSPKPGDGGQSTGRSSVSYSTICTFTTFVVPFDISGIPAVTTT